MAMTTNTKKLKLIKMIVESDETGVEKICDNLFGDSNECIVTGLTKEKLIETFAKVYVDEVSENPELILEMSFIAYLIHKTADELNLK